MFTKKYNEISLIKHLAAATIGTPLLIAATTALPQYLTTPDKPELATGWLFLALSIGLPLGIFLGFLFWLMHRGINTIVQLGRSARDSYRQGQYEARVGAAYETIEDQRTLDAINEEVDNPNLYPRSGATPLPHGYLPEAPVIDTPRHQYHAPPVIDDPVPNAQPNPTVCCQHRRDQYGGIIHGGPDCRRITPTRWP